MRIRDLINAIIIAEEIKLRNEEKVKETVKEWRSYFRHIGRIEVKGSSDVVKIDGEKVVIEEIVMKVNSPNFSINIEYPSGVFSKSYEELSKLSPSSKTIDAFEDAEDGTYVIALHDLSFNGSVKISLTGDVTVLYGFVKYRVYM